jgi:tetratricopeptide (TPR) repeat protein
MDPTFAPAYVGLALAFSELGTVFVGAPPDGDGPKVVSAARRALELDPDLAEAHVLLANVLQQQWHWADAEAEYRRALELNPNDADAHARLALWLYVQGRTDEAVAWAKRGRELDPLAVSQYSTDIKNNPRAGAVGPGGISQPGSRRASNPARSTFPFPASSSTPTILRTMCFRKPLPVTR